MWLAVPEAARPEAVRAHTADCARCRAEQDRQERLRRLVGLKRYERPDPFAADRLAARVREGLASREPAQGDDVVFGPFRVPLPIIRYAAAAALLLVVAQHFLRPGSAELADGLAVQRAVPARSAPVAASWSALPAWPSAAPSPAAWSMPYDTNFHRPMQSPYGPRATFVNFTTP